jgi:transposase-like protein
MKCRKCDSDRIVKNGHHLGKQRFKCKECGFQFTRQNAKGRSPKTKCLAILLYLSGLSLRATASLVNVSPKAVLDWVRAFATATYEKPIPKGEVVIELDEMWHFITSKKTSSGYGKRIVVLQVNSLIGSVEDVILIR